MVQDGSDALESRVDQMVTECVHGILFAVRAFLCFFPVVIFGPLVDWLTCWRFLVSARGLKYIWTGDVMGDRASLFTEGYVVTDGVCCFNVYDIFFCSLFFSIVVMPVAFFTIIVDICTLNKFKVHSFPVLVCLA
jgi:hypothetical protein